MSDAVASHEPAMNLKDRLELSESFLQVFIPAFSVLFKTSLIDILTAEVCQLGATNYHIDGNRLLKSTSMRRCLSSDQLEISKLKITLLQAHGWRCLRMDPLSGSMIGTPDH